MSRKQKRTSKKLLHALRVFVPTVGVVLIFFIGIFLYTTNFFGAPTHPDFRAYHATVPLNGNTVSGSTLTRVRQSYDSWRFDYVTTYDPDGTAMYQRSTASGAGIYNCNSMGRAPDYAITCTSRSTKNGGHYIVVVDRYKGEVFSVTAEATIGTTGLYVSVPENKAARYAAYDWQRFFDSLEPVDIYAMPYHDRAENSSGP